MLLVGWGLVAGAGGWGWGWAGQLGWAGLGGLGWWGQEFCDWNFVTGTSNDKQFLFIYLLRV